MPSSFEAAVEERVEEEREEERRTSYLELFFDLVFVFAITQVTALILSDTSAAGFARSLLMLALVWWAWSGFAWMTNSIDIDDRVTRVAMLVAMAAVFMMAFAIPAAFEGDGEWFGAAYLAVAVLNILLYLRGAKDDAELFRSVARLAPFFLLGPVLAFVGGFLDGGVRNGLWVAAVLVNLVGALDAGGRVWRVSAAHFAERHASRSWRSGSERSRRSGTWSSRRRCWSRSRGRRRCGGRTSASWRAPSSVRSFAPPTRPSADGWRATCSPSRTSP
jgi:low temperature requirement protein LtrA